MKVKELIRRLQELDEEKEIKMFDCDSETIDCIACIEYDLEEKCYVIY